MIFPEWEIIWYIFRHCFGQGIEVQLFILGWPCHKADKITFLLLFILSVRDFRRLVHYVVIVGVIESQSL